MKEYVLSYYDKFKCIAEKCSHTCCAGWEMCIDKDSLTAYQSDCSNFSSALKKGINFKKSKFKYDKSKRCAFLNEKGLCEIIINLGEQSLCQVCRDHPRFRSFFDDRVELGLGFCCEQATRIILSFDGKIEPKLILDDGKEETLALNQKFVLEFREKALDLIQDQNLSINERITNLLSLCSADTNFKCDKKIIRAFLALERLDKSWTARLKSLKGKPLVRVVEEDLAPYSEKFIANSLYRHLSNSEDTMSACARIIAIVVCWWVIQSILTQEKSAKEFDFELVVDVVRAFSAEVEYSQKNLDKLFNTFYSFIKI
jgi:lysine-N-methylase